LKIEIERRDHLGEELVDEHRRIAIKAINSNPRTKEDLLKTAAKGEEVWNEETLKKEFEVTGVLPPYIGVKRKLDGKIGTMVFQYDPLYYWGFREST